MVSSELDDITRTEGVRAAVNPARFNVAGIIFTYRCSIACRHCLFSCGPHHPSRFMEPAQCVAALQVLRRFPRVVHIAGGDCFLDYRRLLRSCQLACEAGVPPHFVETNAAWCTNDDLVMRRFGELRAVGVLGCYISCDPYHQEFVDPDKVTRCWRCACDVFGEKNVLGQIERLCDADVFRGISGDRERLSTYVREHTHTMFIGNAFAALAGFLDRHDPSHFSEVRCGDRFDLDTMWEFHVDPYFNIQTNCGILLGNIGRDDWRQVFTQNSVRNNPVIRIVSEEGPLGLLEFAVSRGMTPKVEGYGHACEMCFDARRFLRAAWPEFLGPEEVYSPFPHT